MAVKEKIRIRIKGYDHQLVDQSAEKIVETARRTGARVSGPVPLPTEKEIVTILRAVHKYKDSREQFESRIHKRLIDILRPSNKTVQALISCFPTPSNIFGYISGLGEILVDEVMFPGCAGSVLRAVGTNNQGGIDNANRHHRQKGRHDPGIR